MLIFTKFAGIYQNMHRGTSSHVNSSYPERSILSSVYLVSSDPSRYTGTVIEYARTAVGENETCT